MTTSTQHSAVIFIFEVQKCHWGTCYAEHNIIIFNIYVLLFLRQCLQQSLGHLDTYRYSSILPTGLCHCAASNAHHIGLLSTIWYSEVPWMMHFSRYLCNIFVRPTHHKNKLHGIEDDTQLERCFDWYVVFCSYCMVIDAMYSMLVSVSITCVCSDALGCN